MSNIDFIYNNRSPEFKSFSRENFSVEPYIRNVLIGVEGMAFKGKGERIIAVDFAKNSFEEFQGYVLEAVEKCLARGDLQDFSSIYNADFLFRSMRLLKVIIDNYSGE